MPGWRPMAAADLPAVSSISDTVHGRYSEPVEVYAERLALHPTGCFVLEADAAPAGYLITHPWRRDMPPKLGAMLQAIPPDADTFYLHDIALLAGNSRHRRGTRGGRTDDRSGARCRIRRDHADGCRRRRPFLGGAGLRNRGSGAGHSRQLRP